MSPPQCPFCAHTNPADAKFCNECGAPLHLRPCNRCEAVNNQVDENCYKCGMALSMPCTAHEAAPVWPALNTVAASASPGDLCFESGHAPLTESVTEGQDVRLRQPDDETAAAHDCAVEIVPRAPRSPGADMTSPISTEDRTANAIPLHDFGTATGPHLLSRLALVVVLSAAVLTAVGVSAYYARAVECGAAKPGCAHRRHGSAGRSKRCSCDQPRERRRSNADAQRRRYTDHTATSHHKRSSRSFAATCD